LQWLRHWPCFRTRTWRIQAPAPGTCFGDPGIRRSRSASNLPMPIVRGRRESHWRTPTSSTRL